MEIPQHLLKRLKKNEEITRKFNEIEISILSILNFKDFFERLLFQIADKFSIPHIWLSIIQESSICQQLKDCSGSQGLKSAIAFVSQERFISIIKNQKPVLANRNLTFFKDLMPDTLTEPIGSLAIAPITLDGKLVGSINQADIDTCRFEPGIDTSLLEQLAQKVSLCLSNVTAHEQLKFLAYHDPLTGLFNRAVFERILDREVSRAKRYNSALSLIFLDFDDFKTINDTAGHSIGDKALCFLADALNSLKRQQDIVARFAGDEFVVILPSTEKNSAAHFIRRINAYFEANPLLSGKYRFNIRISHGISSLSDAGVYSSSELLKRADSKMYQHKAEKKKR
ncbi:MAG: sensor domain-containing diguanylate cyclase [Desulfobacter sp.]|uniref:sensor domain-containing diguanylate cyclase n=1 Tax=uncultured Desulfobacter sp. TaxID=240139 RepID=UPI0029C8FC2E|nr:sensor domain-containing diguanylate cyclase [uncultured Desulfobacter sp.]MCW8800233.1 sensor domain-containing diguanylate cyclase [Desulfobacter sp.]